MKMKNILIYELIFIFITMCGIVSAITPIEDVYMDVNRTYPLTLIPLDENIWNITLNVYDGNWSSFNFTWNGSVYQLSILFNTIGDYPFVINSTEVAGDIRGTFLVRQPFNATFRFIKRTQSYVFFSNKYINNYAYVTAELLTNPRKYDDNIEPFFAQLPLTSRAGTPAWFGEYTNGVATIKLYEGGTYVIRLIDGEITFPNEYSVPNITQSYGVNSYIGQYALNNTSSYEILLTSKMLKPYTWLFNIVLIILIIVCVIGAVFVFFAIPQSPAIAISLGLVLPIILIIIRIILYIWIA